MDDDKNWSNQSGWHKPLIVCFFPPDSQQRHQFKWLYLECTCLWLIHPNVPIKENTKLVINYDFSPLKYRHFPDSVWWVEIKTLSWSFWNQSHFMFLDYTAPYKLHSYNFYGNQPWKILFHLVFDSEFLAPTCLAPQMTLCLHLCRSISLFTIGDMDRFT